MRCSGIEHKDLSSFFCGMSHKHGITYIYIYIYIFFFYLCLMVDYWFIFDTTMQQDE